MFTVVALGALAWLFLHKGSAAATPPPGTPSVGTTAAPGATATMSAPDSTAPARPMPVSDQQTLDDAQYTGVVASGITGGAQQAELEAAVLQQHTETTVRYDATVAAAVEPEPALLTSKTRTLTPPILVPKYIDTLT